METSRVGKISTAVARLDAAGRSWFPTSKNVGIPARDNRFRRLANSRWYVDHLKKFFGSDLNQEETFTARRRHLNSINQAHDCFAAATEQINNNQATDLVAEELLQAQNAISEITGEFTNEDLLEKIFSRFCIGK